MSYYIKIGNDDVKVPRSCYECHMWQSTYTICHVYDTPKETTVDSSHNKIFMGYYCTITNKNIEDVSKRPKWCPIQDDLMLGWNDCYYKEPKENGMYLVAGRHDNEPYQFWLCEYKIIYNIGGWLNDVNNPPVQKWISLPKNKGE